MLLRLLLLLSILLLSSTNSDAGPGRRVALVIGNSSYQHTAQLANPANDASDVAALLAKLGFEVISAIDLDKAGMDRVVRTFAEKLNGADFGVFFYAGHGLQYENQNYLVPTDAKLSTPSALDFEMIRLDLVQRSMERETRTNILLIDACRDNPLGRNLARALGTRSASIGQGLAAVESGEGTLIGFSTQPGNYALDGDGRNSPFAAALVKHLGTPGDDLSTVLINVRNDVMAATQRRQVPWDHSALTARVYFGERTGPAAGPTFEQQAELSLWTSVKDATDPALLRTYLDRFPDGTFAATARLLAEKLTHEANERATASKAAIELARAEEAKKAAEAAKQASELKEMRAKEAQELRRAQEEAKKTRDALAKAEAELAAARKAEQDARLAAEAAKEEREKVAEGAGAKKASGTRSSGNCFTFNNRTFCH